MGNNKNKSTNNNKIENGSDITVDVVDDNSTKKTDAEKTDTEKKTEDALNEILNDNISEKTDSENNKSDANSSTNNKDDNTIEDESKKDDAKDENESSNSEEATKETDVNNSEEKVDEKEEKADAKEEKADAKDEKTDEEKVEENSKSDSKDTSKYPDNLTEDSPIIDSSIYYYKKKKKRFKIAFGIFTGILLAVYIGGVVFHSLRFVNNTYINDVNVSGKSIEEVENIFQKDMDSYTLDIVFKNGTETLKKGDGGIDFAFKKSIKEIKQQNNPFLWFVDLFTEDHYSLDYSVVYDKNTLADFVLGFDYFLPYNMQPSIDAKVEMVAGEVIVTPEKLGTKMDTDLVMDAIYRALDSYQPKVDLVNERCYYPAKITEDSEEIINTKKNAESYLAIKAQLDFGNYVYQIPREDLSDMAYLDEKGEVVISKRNVEIYARKLDEKFTTIDKMREFVTHDNKKILIWGDGYYGWVMDPVAEAEELYEYMKTKKDFTKEVACTVRGYAMSDMNDIGESYVEVDLEDQHVYLYINGRLILDSPCVSGRPSMLTPGGLYGLTYKAYDATLKGEDYETKVSFWMPFNWDIGLHDAIWRADFGGDIYTYDGSHGCVNLPYDVANTIFDYIDGGFPIVCYWDSEVTVVEENVDND